MAVWMRRGKAIEWSGESPLGMAAGSEEAVMGESIGVEWIHLPFYEAIRSGRGGQVTKAGCTKVENIRAQAMHTLIIEKVEKLDYGVQVI